MKVNVKKRVGETVFDFEFDVAGVREVFEIPEKLRVLDEINQKTPCSLCGNGDISLRKRDITSKKDNKTYTYFEAVCLKCGATLKISERQDKDKTLFVWKNKYEWSKYVPKEAQEQGNSGNEEVPF